MDRPRFPALLGLLLISLMVGPAHAGAAEPAPASSVLFALDAREGSLAPVKGKKQTYNLTLRGVDKIALSFDDRPGKTVGTIRVKSMIEKLFLKGQAPPNAAVNADVPGTKQALMGVRLGSPRYSSRTRTLRFRVQELIQRKGSRGERQRTDVVLPRRFGRTALFIDNCCGAAQAVTVFNTNVLGLTVQVNNGPQFSIAGTGAYSGWTPQAPTFGGPTFSNASPSPNTFGPGTNYVTMTPIGSVQPLSFPISIPASVQFTSLQLYIGFNSNNVVQWTLFNNGQLVTSGLEPAR